MRTSGRSTSSQVARPHEKMKRLTNEGAPYEGGGGEVEEDVEEEVEEEEARHE